jgi:hypothetical protein
LNWWRDLLLRVRGSPALGPPLTPDVFDRVVKEYSPDMRPTVEAQLRRYSAAEYASEPERVQLAILELAKGNVRDVAQYTKAALNDYRDVLYWAYYYDDDPFWPLTGLIDELVEKRKITAQDAFRIRNEPGVTAYRGILLGLIAELTARQISITAEQRNTLNRLCGLLKVAKKQLKAIPQAGPSKGQ